MQGYNSIPNSGEDLPQKEEVLTPNIQTNDEYAPPPISTPQPLGNINPFLPQVNYNNQNMVLIGNIPVSVTLNGRTYVPNPMTELEICNSVSIDERSQHILGWQCRYPNKYEITSEGKYLFRCIEDGDNCQRNCCAANKREFTLYFIPITDEGSLRNDDFQNSVIKVQKPFNCPFFCCKRPEMTITFSQGGQILGKIEAPFSCCDPVFLVYDDTGGCKYYISTSCCQCGVACNNSICGLFSTNSYYISNNNSRENSIGTIIRKPSDIGGFDDEVYRHYKVNFPNEASTNEKLLLINAALMIDYQMYDTKISINDNNN